MFIIAYNNEQNIPKALEYKETSTNCEDSKRSDGILALSILYFALIDYSLNNFSHLKKIISCFYQTILQYTLSFVPHVTFMSIFILAVWKFISSTYNICAS